jgi:polysaccharide export outer membrane protein
MFKSSRRLFLLSAIVAACLAGCSSGQSVQTAIVTHQPVTAGPYVIAPDDQIEVIVWKQREVSGKVVVAQDGTITVPLAGRITAAGLTSDELQQEVTHRLTAFIDAPNVTVRVADARSQTVYITGEVQKPGALRLRPGEVLSQALAEAGGFTEFAALGKIRITRRSPTQTEQISVDYNLVQSGRDLSGDVPLMAGDVVHVP